MATDLTSRLPVGGGSESNRFPGGGGSRRDKGARDRILAATVELLTEAGYGDLTIEAVAARAGVGKPTIYRWWSNKAHLAYDASCVSADREVPTDTGDFELDLRRFVERCSKFLWRDEVTSALRGMLTDPWVLRTMNQEQGRPARRHFRAIIEAGMASGSVRPDVDADAVCDLAVGAILHRALLPGSRQRGRQEWIDSIVMLLLQAVQI